MSDMRRRRSERSRTSYSRAQISPFLCEKHTKTNENSVTPSHSSIDKLISEVSEEE